MEVFSGSSGGWAGIINFVLYKSKLTSYKFTDLPTRADFAAAESEWSIPCPLPSVMPLYQPASIPP